MVGLSYCINNVNLFYNSLKKIKDDNFNFVWTKATNNAKYEDKEYKAKRIKTK